MSSDIDLEKLEELFEKTVIEQAEELIEKALTTIKKDESID